MTTKPARWRRPLIWLRQHRKTRALLLILLVFSIINFVAYRQARAMLIYGESVPRPVSHGIEDPALGISNIQFRADTNIVIAGTQFLASEPRGTVICFHGFGGGRDSLNDHGRLFQSLGYHTLLIDFRGCGASSGNEATIGYDEANDVRGNPIRPRTCDAVTLCFVWDVNGGCGRAAERGQTRYQSRCDDH